MSHSKIALLIIFFAVTIGLLLTCLMQQLQQLFFYNLFIGTLASFFSTNFLLRRIRKGIQFDKLNKLLIGLVAGLVTFSFLATVPLTIDRSYSVWILKSIYISERNSEMVTSKQIESKSIAFFSPNNGQLTRRIAEQKKIGNIEVINSNELSLTDRGRLITQLNALVGWIFGLDPDYSRI